MTRKPDADKPPLKVRELTSTTVEQCLREAWPKAPKYPDSEMCSRAATRINSLFGPDERNRDQTKALRNQIERFDNVHNAYLALARSARAFLRSLPDSETVRDDLLKRERIAAIYDKPSEDAANCALLMLALDVAVPALATIAKTCEPPKFWQRRDPIVWIADRAREVWAETDPTVTLGVDPAGSLNQFVRLALRKIGIRNPDGEEFSDETVYDHLRDRVGGGGRRKRSARSGSHRE